MPRKLKGKQATVLTDDQYDNLLIMLNSSKHAARDKVMFALSFKCGLRAVEIAGLRWRDVLDSEGKVIKPNNWINLPAGITKGNVEGQKVMMHPQVYQFLVELKKDVKRRRLPFKWDTHLMYATSEGVTHFNAAYIAVYMQKTYKKFGIKGASSHSGRRTFITKLARACNEVDCSIADVQRLARHVDIRTTERYIDPANRITDLAGLA